MGWSWFEVSIESENSPHAVASGPVSLTSGDLAELNELLDQLCKAAAGGRRSRTLRWDTYESSIELQFTWWGDAGEASGRFDQNTGRLAFEAIFERVSIERDAVERMRDELDELLTQLPPS